MNLQGSLDAFSLPDIFQLLTATRKTGALHLYVGTKDGVVWFADGTVNGASSDGARQSLARRLVGAGAVPDDALHAAVERAAGDEGIGVVRALLDGGAVAADVVTAAAREHTVDAVFDLLRWAEGDFAFTAAEPNPDDVGLRLSVEEILHETEVRGTEWERLSRLVPTTDAVLRIPATPPTDFGVRPEEWALMALVDGRRSIRELIELTGSVRFTVITRLAGLIERGLLVTGDRDDDPAAALARRQAILARLEAPAEEPFDEALADALTGPAEDDALLPDGDDLLAGGSIVPPRPEPFLPSRRAEFAEGSAGQPSTGGGVALAEPQVRPVLERDPAITRSLMLRLIAGVRGL